MDGNDPLEELRVLGLAVEIEENAARKILAELLIVDGKLRQGAYAPSDQSSHTRGHFYAAYHAIAAQVVRTDTPDALIDYMIPAMVEAYKVKQNWLPKIALDLLTRWLLASQIMCGT